MHLHVEFRDIKKWKYSIQIFFFTQKYSILIRKTMKVIKEYFVNFIFILKELLNGN